MDVATYRQVVGHFATGVAVVTAATRQGPAGFTCQSFGSLSLEPVLVTFSAALGGRSWPRVRDVGVVGVSILAEGQEALARLFATSGADKFSAAPWAPAPGGSPLLEGALAHLEARVLGVTTHGDHDQVVAAVEYAVAHPGRPLLYYRGGYAGVT